MAQRIMVFRLEHKNLEPYDAGGVEFIIPDMAKPIKLVVGKDTSVLYWLQEIRRND